MQKLELLVPLYLLISSHFKMLKWVCDHSANPPPLRESLCYGLTAGCPAAILLWDQSALQKNKVVGYSEGLLVCVCLFAWQMEAPWKLEGKLCHWLKPSVHAADLRIDSLVGWASPMPTILAHALQQPAVSCRWNRQIQPVQGRATVLYGTSE